MDHRAGGIGRLLAAGAAAAFLALPSFGQPSGASVASGGPQNNEQPRRDRSGHERSGSGEARGQHPHHAQFQREPSPSAETGPTAASALFPQYQTLYHPGVDPQQLRDQQGLGPQQLAALGAQAYQNNDYAVATEAAQLALAADPHEAAAQAVLSLSRGRGSAPSVFATAEDAAVKATPVFTASPLAAVQSQPAGRQKSQVLTSQAAQALAIGDYTAALEAAKAATASDPSDARAWNLSAVARTKLGDYGEAVTDATRALSLDANQPAALITRSLAKSKLGQYAAAAQDARDALELERSGRDAHSLEALAFALAGQGDRAGALEQLRQAADLSADAAPLYAKASELAQAKDIAALFAEPGRSAGAPAARGARWLALAVPGVLGLGLILLGLLPRREEKKEIVSRAYCEPRRAARV